MNGENFAVCTRSYWCLCANSLEVDQLDLNPINCYVRTHPMSLVSQPHPMSCVTTFASSWPSGANDWVTSWQKIYYPPPGRTMIRQC
jgi:hypothetical protein